MQGVKVIAKCNYAPCVSRTVGSACADPKNMDILNLECFVEVQYDIFKILSPNNIYRSLPSLSKASF